MDMARNELVEVFYTEPFTECDRLLMVDSDIEFTPDDVRRLEADDLPVVSGVYHSNYGGQVLPVVYDWVDLDGVRSMKAVQRWPDCEFDEEPDNPICTAPGVGAGFLMVKREVFDALGERHELPCRWFAEEIRNGVLFGEDLTFGLRVAEAGFPVHVDRRVQVAHHKSVRLGGREVAVPSAV